MFYIEGRTTSEGHHEGFQCVLGYMRECRQGTTFSVPHHAHESSKLFLSFATWGVRETLPTCFVSLDIRLLLAATEG